MGIQKDYYRQYFPELRVPVFKSNEPIDVDTINEKINVINDNINATNKMIMKLSLDNPAWLIEYFKNNTDGFYFKSITLESLTSYIFNDEYINNATYHPELVNNPPYDSTTHFIIPCNDLKYEQEKDLIVHVFHSEKGLISSSEYYISDAMRGLNIFVAFKNSLYPDEYNFDKINEPHTFHILILKRNYDLFEPTFFKDHLIIENLINSNYVTVRQLNKYSDSMSMLDSNLRFVVTANNKNQSIVVVEDKNGDPLPIYAEYEVKSSFDGIDIDATIKFDETKNEWNVLYLYENSGPTIFDIEELNKHSDGLVLKIPLCYYSNDIKHIYGFNTKEEFLVFIDGIKISPTEFTIKSNFFDGAYIELLGYFPRKRDTQIRITKNLAFTAITNYKVIKSFSSYCITENLPLSGDLLSYETAFAFSNGRIVKINAKSVLAKIAYFPDMEYNHLELINNTLCTETNKNFLEDLDRYTNPVDYTLLLLNLSGQSYKNNIIQNYINTNQIQPKSLKPVDYNKDFTYVGEKEFGGIKYIGDNEFSVDEQYIDKNDYYFWFCDHGAPIVVYGQGKAVATIGLKRDSGVDEKVGFVRCKRTDKNGVTTLSNNVEEVINVVIPEGNPIVNVEKYNFVKLDWINYELDLKAKDKLNLNIDDIKVMFKGEMVQTLPEDYYFRWTCLDDRIKLPTDLTTNNVTISFSELSRPTTAIIELKVMKRTEFDDENNLGIGGYQLQNELDSDSPSDKSTTLLLNVKLSTRI